MAKIYESYKLKITDDEGERYIKINKNVDTSNYREMIKFYNELKKRNEEKSCTIHFLGVDRNKIENIMFSKEYKQEENKDKELLISTDEIVGEIKHLLGLLERKKSYHHNMESVLDKRQDVLLHNIEECASLQDREKLVLINNLEKLRKDRRFTKNELSKIRVVDKIVNINEVSELFEKINIPINETEYKFLDEKELAEKEILEEIKFSSDRDRIHKMSQIQGKYEKVFVDHANKVIIAYNKSNKRNKIK